MASKRKYINSKDSFIKEATKKFKNKFDYSKVQYFDIKTPVEIICPIHGSFWQSPRGHLKSDIGCPKCIGEKNKNKYLKNSAVFFNEVEKIHKEKYDYSKSIYLGADKEIEIICPIHGSFWQRAKSHRRGAGCDKCADINRRDKRRNSNKDFIKKAKKIHGDKYDYSLINYKNNSTKIKIICPEHGVFEQAPSNHLVGQDCPKCAHIQRINSLRSDTETFIKRAQKIHHNKYDYSLVDYKTNKGKVKIICPEHGGFEQTPTGHLNGYGCPKCGGALKKCTEEFIKEAQNIHGNKYNYSRVNYINAHNKVKIICPEHGEFGQTPSAHINEKHGCPNCAVSGFKSNKPAILYYLKDKETDLYKIGITNLTLIKRFGKAFCSKRAMILLEQTYENGELAYLAEQEILQAFAPYRCVNESWPQEKGGKTEFFCGDVLKLDNLKCN